MKRAIVSRLVAVVQAVAYAVACVSLAVLKVTIRRIAIWIGLEILLITYLGIYILIL
jgi:hypothetical protein